jgi:imidazolonepropionase
MRADRILEGFSQIATLAEGKLPRVGPAMHELSVIEDASVAIDRGRVVAVGPRRTLRRSIQLRSGGRTDPMESRCAIPGFVDAHTHVLFAGSRHDELALKLSGASYREIAERGGGLLSTVRATRKATDGQLLRETGRRLRRMLANGTTSAEVKSGYALTHEGELRLLRLVPRLARETGMQLVATYLGAHAIPPEHATVPDEYVREMIERTLPEVARKKLARFCDAFLEPGFFSAAQCERLLAAARALGLATKLHTDEFESSGGASLAARVGCRSADHLLASTREGWADLARAGTTAVLLPTTALASFSARRPPGRELVDAGVAVALGTDCSPNSWVESMALVAAHGVYSARLTPAEALCAATANAAYAIGLEASAGQISVGREADLAVFDVRSVEEIPYRIGLPPVQIYRRGAPVLPSTLRE